MGVQQLKQHSSIFVPTYERASVTVDISLIQKDLNGETDTSKITGSSESD